MKTKVTTQQEEVIERNRLGLKELARQAADIGFSIVAVIMLIGACINLIKVRND